LRFIDSFLFLACRSFKASSLTSLQSMQRRHYRRTMRQSLDKQLQV
jgi:hypothetical protein